MSVYQISLVGFALCFVVSCGQDGGANDQPGGDLDAVDTAGADSPVDTNDVDETANDIAEVGDVASDTASDAESDAESDSVIGDLDGDPADTAPEDTAPADTAPEDLPLDVLVDLEVIESLVNVLGFDVEWSSTIPLPSVLAVDCDDVRFSLVSVEYTTSHRAFVTGLVAETECVVEVSATVNGRTQVLSAEFSVDVLPDYLPAVPLAVNDPEQRDPGWTLLNLSNLIDGIPLLLAMFDEQGRYRWYYRSTVDGSGGDVAATLVGNRVLVGARKPIRAALIDLDGSRIWESEFPNAHHEARWLGDDLVYLLVPACDVLEWNIATDTQVWHWDLEAHYAGQSETGDWLHCNSVSPVGDGILVSSRNQNSIFWVDRATGDIEWVLGRQGKLGEQFQGDFAMDEADQFLQQHDPEMLENGNILLFDNGTAERGFSRALELELVFGGEDGLEPVSARAVWEYRHDPEIQTPIWGDADRLPNGNTLITFGLWNPEIGSTVVEVNAAAEPVWELAFPPKWGVYRAERIDTVYGYIRPTPTE